MARRTQLVGRWLQLPPWAQALIVYAVTRLVDVVVLTRAARFQPASLWTTASPDYLGFVSLWDAEWYHRIADTGYPPELPRDETGQVRQNEWAFYPLYPLLVRLVMRATGAEWPLAASMTSLLCGAAAVVVLRSLVDRIAGRSVGLWTVALFCAFPAAPVLQLAYTESAAALLLFAALWCLQRRRYLLAVPVVLAVGIARPIAVPLAAVVGLHLLRRILRRGGDPLPPGELARLLVLTAASGMAAVEWPLIVAWRTGEPGGYTDTMGAWRAGHHMAPFRPWWDMSRYWLGEWAGPIAVVVVVLALLWWLTRPVARMIAGDLRAWVVCYLGYMLAVLDPSTSLVRYLLLAFPLGVLAVVASPSLAYRRALVAAFVAGQVVWVVYLWRFIPPTDWPP